MERTLPQVPQGLTLGLVTVLPVRLLAVRRTVYGREAATAAREIVLRIDFPALRDSFSHRQKKKGCRNIRLGFGT